MPLENFFILHQNGECVFMNNYHGDPLPLHTILGLSSCMSLVIGATNKANLPNQNTNPTGGASSKGGEANLTGDGHAQQQQPGGDGTTSSTVPSPLCTITVNGYKFVYLDHAPYTLVAQGNGEESEQFLGNYIYDVRDLIQTYLGNGVVNEDDVTAIKGIVDFIHHLLIKYTTDLSYLCSGTRWVYLDEEVREQVDRLLTRLEENSIVTAANSTGGNLTNIGQPDITGSMLVLGGSILHSRMPTFISRMLLHHLSCRPLGAAKLRTLPLYFEGSWKHYVFLRLRHMTLVTSIQIKSQLSKLISLCQEFEEDLIETNLNLPIEEPPVLLRHYTGHDTIAFLYHHHLTGVTVAPPPRNTSAGATISSQAGPGPSSSTTANSTASSIGIGAKATEQLANQAELTKTLQVFNWFYSRANQLLTKSYVSEVILHLKGYRFYGVHEDEFSLFILYSENVSVPALASYNKEILENVLRHNGALIAE